MLKTKQDLKACIILSAFPGICIYENNELAYATRRKVLEFNLDHPIYYKPGSLNILRKKTGITNLELYWDFMYHWYTNFTELQTFEVLRERIKNSATAASYATTIAVNRYIEANSPTEKELQKLFYKCSWRWKKTPSGYIQTFFYELDLNSQILNLFFYNPNLYSTRDKITSLQELKPIIRDRAISHYNLFLEQQRERENNLELMNYSSRATDVFSFKV